MTASFVTLQLLATLATATGAGVATTVLLDLLRVWFPVTTFVGQLLDRRDVMRLLSIVLPIVLAGTASAILAAIRGEPVLSAVDAALGAAVLAQLAHIRALYGEYQAVRASNLPELPQNHGLAELPPSAERSIAVVLQDVPVDGPRVDLYIK